MGKDSTSDHDGLDRVEQLAELLDEDHLEFEEVLLDIKQRLESLSTTVKLISRRIDDFASDLDEYRQVQAGMDAKIDQLRISVSGLVHRMESNSPSE